MGDARPAAVAVGALVGAIDGDAGVTAAVSAGDAVAAGGGVAVSVMAAVWVPIRVSAMIVRINTARRGAANATSTPITIAAEELRRR